MLTSTNRKNFKPLTVGKCTVHTLVHSTISVLTILLLLLLLLLLLNKKIMSGVSLRTNC